MNFTVAAAVFGVVFLAELPDKTALASLVLGARYRPWYVFVGGAAAFLLHALLAVAAGSLLTLLPDRVVEAVVAALFLGGAVFILVHHRDHEPGADGPAADARFWKVALTCFTVVAVAEIGDLTQILTATLAARYKDPVSVGVGATLALWSVAALAIAGGRNLLRILPVTWVVRVAAIVMAVMAGFSAYRALRG